MRYDGYTYRIDIHLRAGVLYVFNPWAPERLERVARLDPGVIGKAMQRCAVPEIAYYPGEYAPRVSNLGPPIRFPYPGELDSPSRWNAWRTTADLKVDSDGYEARFSLLEQPIPNSKAENASINLTAVLASTPTVRPEDNGGPRSPLLIVPWRDAEMLGAGALAAFRHSGPAFIGPESIFEAPEPKGRTALHRAARDGDMAALPSPGRRRKVDRADAAGITPLMLAADSGRPDATARLLELGADPDRRDHQGRTPVHYAAAGGNSSILRDLLGAGAAAESYDLHGETPLHLAASESHLEAAEALLNAGVSPSVADGLFGSTPLHLTARDGHTDLAKLLIAFHANLEAANVAGQTALHLASGYGHTETAQALLDAGANPNSRDSSGQTPLHLAAFFQHLDCLKLLLNRDAHPDTADAFGSTPLHVASGMNRDRAAVTLMDCGADLEARDNEELTPLDIAIVNQHSGVGLEWRYPSSEHNSEAASALLERGASLVPERIPVGERHILWPHLTPRELIHGTGSLDTRKVPGLRPESREVLAFFDGKGYVPHHGVVKGFSILHDAAFKDLPFLVNKLLDSGASPMTASEGIEARTPLHWAALAGQMGIAKVLLDRGADPDRPACNVLDGRYEPDERGPRSIESRRETPLDYAVRWGNVEMAGFLLERGATPNPGIEEMLCHESNWSPIERREALADLFHQLGISRYTGRQVLERISRGFEELIKLGSFPEFQARDGMFQYLDIDPKQLMTRPNWCPRYFRASMVRKFREYGLID